MVKQLASCRHNKFDPITSPQIDHGLSCTLRQLMDWWGSDQALWTYAVFQTCSKRAAIGGEAMSLLSDLVQRTVCEITLHSHLCTYAVWGGGGSTLSLHSWCWCMCLRELGIPQCHETCDDVLLPQQASLFADSIRHMRVECCMKDTANRSSLLSMTIMAWKPVDELSGTFQQPWPTHHTLHCMIAVLCGLLTRHDQIMFLHAKRLCCKKLRWTVMLLCSQIFDLQHCTAQLLDQCQAHICLSGMLQNSMTDGHVWV